MASKGADAAARCRANNAASVVLPLPPLPTKAIFTVESPPRLDGEMTIELDVIFT
jgi:hypothetical protein